MNEMQKWLANYERIRHYKQPREQNQSWISSKYPIHEMHWQELQKLYLPEIQMCFGPACSSLRRLWKSYKIAGRNGEPRADIAWKINRIQSAMGIEKSQFPELEGMGDNEESEEELTDELKREEKQESGAGEWESNLSLNSATSEPYTEEWSEEDKELLKEEREAEEENDDWWFT